MKPKWPGQSLVIFPQVSHISPRRDVPILLSSTPETAGVRVGRTKRALFVISSSDAFITSWPESIPNDSFEMRCGRAQPPTQSFSWYMLLAVSDEESAGQNQKKLIRGCSKRGFKWIRVPQKEPEAPKCSENRRAGCRGTWIDRDWEFGRSRRAWEPIETRGPLFLRAMSSKVLYFILIIYYKVEVKVKSDGVWLLCILV